MLHDTRGLGICPAVWGGLSDIPTVMPRKPKYPGKPGRPPKNKKKSGLRSLTRELLFRIHELDRYFRALRKDPSRPLLPLKELVEHHRIPRSTLVKDLRTMRETFNAPLKFIKERGGWGYTEDAAYLPNILISEGDLTVLCASWGALERRRNSGWGDRVRPVMEKLVEAMRQEFSIDFSAISERIVFRGSGYQDAVEIGIFEQVVSAVLGTHELEIVYCKTLDDGSVAPPEVRLVQPRCLVCVDHAWYVVANDPMREGKARRFALFRMQSAKDTDREFVPNGAFDLEEVLGKSRAIHGGGEEATVEVLFQKSVARYAREQFWHKSEKFDTAEDGRLRLRMEVAVNPEVEMRILRYGAQAEVVEPVALRERFEQQARMYGEVYLGKQAD